MVLSEDIKDVHGAIKEFQIQVIRVRKIIRNEPKLLKFLLHVNSIIIYK